MHASSIVFLICFTLVGCGGRVDEGPSPPSAPSEKTGSGTSTGSGSTTGVGSSTPGSTTGSGTTSGTCEGVGTFDCPESIATAICAGEREHGKPCQVCVQQVDQLGDPLLWMALEVDDGCKCPTPDVLEVSVDAGPAPDDAGGEVY